MSIIRHVSGSTKGGYLSVITGDNMMNAKKVCLTAQNGEEYWCEVLNRTVSTATFRVPEGKYRSYKVKVIYSDGESNTLTFNAPKILWVLENNLFSGGELRVIGESLIDIDVYGEREGTDTKGGYGKYAENRNTRIFLKGDTEHELAVKRISNYEVCADIPDSVAAGEYDVIVMRDTASEPYRITVRSKTEYPSKVFNVCDFGAKSIPVRDVYYESFFDSTDAFQAALDAARDNGGGTVFVPNGRYCFKKGIRIYPHTRLLGEDKKRVWIETPKGMGGEDGWGTHEEGRAIYAVIAGEAGDFTIENLNILTVYSPAIIMAPMIHGDPIIGNDTYNYRPLYSNLIDEEKHANNIVIRNCCLIHQPTFFGQRKKAGDPYYTGRYNNNEKCVENPSEGYFAYLEHYSAIAIKGDNVTIESNRIFGAGSCIRLLGTHNASLSSNELFSGTLGNCFGKFSQNYNPNSTWMRQVNNIIMENNLMKPITDNSRGVMWIMEDHSNYYMRGNTLEPFSYTSDNEGFCFHYWGQYYRIRAVGGQREISLNMDSLIDRLPAYKGMLTEDKKFLPDVFKGWYFYVTGGKGVYQIRHVVSNGADTLTLDEPLDCELDESSIISVSNVAKFTNNIVTDNVVGDLGRGVYVWGGCVGAISDGNTLSMNSGVLYEDLSMNYENKRDWQSAGAMGGQIINNKLTTPRGFCSNYGVIGVKCGTLAASSISVIIRSNVCEDDAILVAKPKKDAEDGLNYEGIVMENNLSKNCEIGIETSPAVGITVSGNEFENVGEPIVGGGERAVIL